MKSLLMLPLWILQIPTQSKSFTKNRVLGNKWLNILGLHVARICVAHSIMRFRMLLLSRKIAPEHRKSYWRDGYILIDNFLDPEQFDSIKTEIQQADAEVRECTQGDTLTHRILLDHSTLPAMPACAAMFEQERFKRLLRFTAGTLTPPAAYIQTIKNKYIDGPADPQKNLHSDTFHPTMKSWYFLDDVSEKNGPFTFVPGSQRLTLTRLRWEYRKSIAISSGSDRYSGNGSLRVTPDDFQDLNITEPVGFKVSANTLIIANTHGFHCRGQAQERSTRTELWTISRSNPFNPFPGIDHPMITTLQNKGLAIWRAHCDRKASARGISSSWHVVKARNTIHND